MTQAPASLIFLTLRVFFVFHSCTGGSLSDLDSKEYALLNNLKCIDGQTTQRELASATGISIGLINAVLKRLIRKGYVKVKAFNKKRVHYFLTPKGARQIIKQSYEGVMHVIQHYQKIEAGVGSLISDCIAQGAQSFYLHGEGDLEQITKSILKRNFGHTPVLKEINGHQNVTVLNLTATEPDYGELEVVNVLKHLN